MSVLPGHRPGPLRRRGRHPVSEDGDYVDTLPCASGGGAEQGCEDGPIVVRTPDRMHFCPTDLTEDLTCPVYSSGAHRYGEEVARVATQALDPAY